MGDCGARDPKTGGVLIEGELHGGTPRVRRRANEEVRGVAGVRDGESSGGVVVGDEEAKELGSDGVGFGVVKGRETRDKKVEVRAVPILDAKVVNDYDEKYGTRHMFHGSRRMIEERQGEG